MSTRRRSPGGNPFAYFFDIDGTLVELASSPGSVAPDADLARILRKLLRSAGGALALVSGRSLNDIAALLPRLDVPLAGQHGAEQRVAGRRVTRPNSASRHFERTKRWLRSEVKRLPPLLLEDKGRSIALHYREAQSLADIADRLMLDAMARLDGGHTLLRGKCVVEIKPADVDKGRAIRLFMRADPFRGRIPVFLGDDVADETGFDAVNALDGVSIKVGPGRTRAHWRVADPGAVLSWLRSGTQLPNDLEGSGPI